MDLRGTVDCVYFLKGQCRNGANCPFRHDPVKLPIGLAVSDGQSKEDCYYFLQGRCSKGSQCSFRHDQAKLKPNVLSETTLKGPSLPPTLATVAAPASHIHTVAPVKSNALAPSAQGHVSTPNGNLINVRPSPAVLNNSTHRVVGRKNVQLPNPSGVLSADPQPQLSNFNNIQSSQLPYRKRKDQDECGNNNPGTSSRQPPKPVPQRPNVQCPVAAVDDVVFNAPKTIEEIRAQKKIKTENIVEKKSTPVTGTGAPAARMKPKLAASAKALPPGESGAIIEVEDIDDFDVDGVDDDDFEAQMRALEDAL